MDNLSGIILAASLFIIMFGMGLSLSPSDFRRIFTSPKAVITGLVNQLIFLPIIGFLLIYLIPVPSEIAIGIIILAACPGGSTSNLITHLSKGDLALSVSLTAISSFATLFTIPFIINLGLQTVLGESTAVQLDLVATIVQIFVIAIIPIILGMLIRSRQHAFAEKMEKPVRIASAIVFLLVLVGIVVKEIDKLTDYIAQAGAIALMLNLATMGLGFYASKVMKLTAKQAVSIAIESGIQNGTLGITIATVLLSNSSYAIAPAVYGLLMFLTGAVIIFLGLRLDRKENQV